VYAYIKGILVECSVNFAIIDAGGVGYKILIPASAYNRLPQIHSEVLLHTSFVVRELSQTIFGFIQKEERDFYEALLLVTGIGPKTALAIIGHLSLHEIKVAIGSDDVTTLCRVPGLGKKGAERLIMEMRDKVSLYCPASSEVSHALRSDLGKQNVSDALSALINLGYTQVTAQKAIKKSLKDLPEGIDVAALIAFALKHV